MSVIVPKNDPIVRPSKSFNFHSSEFIRKNSSSRFVCSEGCFAKRLGTIAQIVLEVFRKR